MWGENLSPADGPHRGGRRAKSYPFAGKTTPWPLGFTVSKNDSALRRNWFFVKLLTAAKPDAREKNATGDTRRSICFSSSGSLYKRKFKFLAEEHRISADYLKKGILRGETVAGLDA